MAGERAVRAPSNGHSMDAETTSPVLLALAKRLRNQRKKLRGIDEIQAKADVGKALNADQEAALASKASIVAAVEELERLTKLLKEPLAEEVAAARQEGEAAAAARGGSLRLMAEWLAEREDAVAKAVGPLRQQLSEAKTNAAADAKAAKLAAAAREAAAKKEGEALVGRLVELLYFATVLDPFALQHDVSHYERHVCLMYAQQAGIPLTPADITNVAVFARMEALGLSKDLALKALLHPNEPLLGDATTGADLAEVVKSIQALDYVAL
ncbi:hypothetical protein APUTEX25_000036, partial [Auxenochlorella protothecoides]